MKVERLVCSRVGHGVGRQQALKAASLAAKAECPGPTPRWEPHSLNAMRIFGTGWEAAHPSTSQPHFLHVTAAGSPVPLEENRPEVHGFRHGKAQGRAAFGFIVPLDETQVVLVGRFALNNSKDLPPGEPGGQHEEINLTIIHKGWLFRQK
jgi:hypothetical protein